MSVKKISEAILGVGVDDTTIDLFESQYPVPTGVSYNSYVILDEKTAILDTVDNRATEPWLANLTEALAGRKPDYLVVSHMEPDHGANIARLAALYPEMQVVGNAKTFLYMDQFFGADAVAKERRVVVKDGESLSLGTHTLTFVLAPMVHWPEVMVSYESSEKVLFSADGFGRFGAVAKFDENADWASEARRYYLNIVGKYGPQVQALLKKAAALDIATICPLHGPVLTGDLSKYLNYYDLWSSYKAEEPEKILVASASIHGHTRATAHIMAEKLRAKGAKVVEMDLTRTDVSYAVTEAFRCGRIVLACATYDGFLFPPMENLLATSFLCGVRLSLSEQIVPLHRLGFAGVVLFVVADQGAACIPQGYHVDVAVVLCVVIGIDDVVAGIRREPLDHLADGFHRMGVVAGQKAFAQQGSAAVFFVIHHGSRIHVNDDVVQIADDHRFAVLVDDAFEIGVQVCHDVAPSLFLSSASNCLTIWGSFSLMTLPVR